MPAACGASRPGKPHRHHRLHPKNGVGRVQVNRVLAYALNSKQLKGQLMEASQLINDANREHARSMSRLLLDAAVRRARRCALCRRLPCTMLCPCPGLGRLDAGSLMLVCQSCNAILKGRQFTPYSGRHLRCDYSEAAVLDDVMLLPLLGGELEPLPVGSFSHGSGGHAAVPRGEPGRGYDFEQQGREFAFNTLLTRHEVQSALVKIRSECAKVRTHPPMGGKACLCTLHLPAKALQPPSATTRMSHAAPEVALTVPCHP